MMFVRDAWLTSTFQSAGQFIAIEFTLNIFGVVVSIDKVKSG
jgi:hypothetical protein